MLYIRSQLIEERRKPEVPDTIENQVCLISYRWLILTRVCFGSLPFYLTILLVTKIWSIWSKYLVYGYWYVNNAVSILILIIYDGWTNWNWLSGNWLCQSVPSVLNSCERNIILLVIWLKQSLTDVLKVIVLSVDVLDSTDGWIYLYNIYFVDKCIQKSNLIPKSLMNGNVL